MSITNDWDFAYAAKVLSHIDGVLSYDTGAGRQAAVGEYVRGAVSGAIGKILAVTGNTASGTLTMTNTVGLFEDNELLEVMSAQPFDGLIDKAASLQGIRIGDTVVDQASGSIVVRAIEYNNAEQTLGAGGGGGTMYGDSYVAFADNSQLDISGGETNIGLADTVGTDNEGDLTTTLVAGDGIDVPGTADTNDSAIIHYDAGTQLVPEQAVIEGVTSGAIGLVEQQYGPADGSIGSLRLVDSDFGAADFADDETLRVQQVVNYDAQVAGQVFSVGDVIVGSVSGATGRVLAVVDDGDSTGRVILADESGTWDESTPDLIQLDSVTIAEVENATFTLNVSTANLPDGTRTEQKPDGIGGSVAQGGIYALNGTTPAVSLNIVRKFNSLYTLSQDTFDELDQLDDDEALDATGKNAAYQIVFDWEIPDLSFRFLRSGGVIDTNNQNIWANAQTVGTQNKITDTAFLYDSTQTFRQPQLYIEQNQEKLAASWLEGQIDVMVKVKSWGDTRFIDPATPALGKLFPGGDPAVDGTYTVFNREFWTSTYDATQFGAAAGGVNTVAIGTGADNAADRNPNGTHTMNWNTGSAATLLVGETFFTNALLGNDQKIGVVVSQTGDAGATGTLEYVLKSGTQFLTTEVLEGEVSGKTLAVNGAPTGVVAGYSADIRFQVTDVECTPSGGTGITGKFVAGDVVTQATTGATGYLVFADTTNDLLYIEVISGTFSGDNDITGSVTGSWDAGTGATYDTTAGVLFAADLNNGEGNFNYVGSVSGDITDANAETMQNVYQYSKYQARAEEETYTFQGPGLTDTGTVGRFYRRLKDAYAEVKPGNPVGVYTGSMAFAQGWFLDTDFIAAADIRAFSVQDDDGGAHSPPNLQSLIVSGVATDWRVAAYRSTGSGLTTILRGEFQIAAVASSRNASADSIIRTQAGGSRAVSPTPADVPDNAVLRVLDPNLTGNYLRFPYTAVDRTLNDYPLTSGTIGAVTSSQDLTQADNAHVVLVEEIASGTQVSNTIQYVAPIPIVYKARLKGFKPFISTGEFGATGANLGVVQTADAIVDLP
jgi:hypothetical protein